MDQRPNAHVAIVSLGCAKNLVDSEVMAGLLKEAGFELTTDPAGADVLVINTCGFIEPAQRESVEAILRFAQGKKTGSLRGLVVAGCLPRRFSAREMAQELPEADAVIGTAEIPLIADVVEGVLRGERVVMAEEAPSFLYHHRLPRLRSTPGYLAYVKLSEGCNHPCTFCTIPRIRGPHRSRPMESIVEEIESLAAEGVQEVVLIGQDTTMYGADLYGRLMLPELLRRLGRTGIPRIRLLYAYPAHVTGELMDAMAETPNVCHYLDIPLQHASHRILKAMRRWGNRQAYENLVADLRRRMADVALRTTFIVGFPGETEADLEELLDFIDSVEFDHVGVFTYAREETTPSAQMEGQVPAREKRRRRAAVMQRQQAVLERVARRRLQSPVRLLLERRGRLPDEWVGRSQYQAPEVDGVTYVRLSDAAPGRIVEARLVGRAGMYDFLAVAAESGLGEDIAAWYNPRARAPSW